MRKHTVYITDANMRPFNPRTVMDLSEKEFDKLLRSTRKAKKPDYGDGFAAEGPRDENGETWVDRAFRKHCCRCLARTAPQLKCTCVG
jgi:hypothetical protein